MSRRGFLRLRSHTHRSPEKHTGEHASMKADGCCAECSKIALVGVRGSSLPGRLALAVSVTRLTPSRVRILLAKQRASHIRRGGRAMSWWVYPDPSNTGTCERCKRSAAEHTWVCYRVRDRA